MRFKSSSMPGDQAGKAPKPKDKAKRPAGQELATVTYNVGDIVGKRGFRDLGPVPSIRPTNPGQPEDVRETLARRLLAALVEDKKSDSLCRIVPEKR